MAQNESIVDLFRYCARKDRILSQALQGDFSGFTLETLPEPEQEMVMGDLAAEDEVIEEEELMTLYDEGQPVRIEGSRPTKRSKIMHYKIAGEYVLEKSEWLCNKKLLVSDFELTFDGLVGDGSSVVSEFVDWESS